MAKFKGFIIKGEKKLINIVKRPSLRSKANSDKTGTLILISILIGSFPSLIIIIFIILSSLLLTLFFLIIWSFLLFLFISIHIDNVKKEKVYLITNNKIIAKAPIIGRTNFSKAPSQFLTSREKIVSVELDGIDRFEIEKKKSGFYINFYIKNDPSNRAWIIFRKLEENESDEVADTLTKLLPFAIKSSQRKKLYTRV